MQSLEGNESNEMFMKLQRVIRKIIKERKKIKENQNAKIK